jgi:NAD-dependent DNA ligase
MVNINKLREENLKLSKKINEVKEAQKEEIDPSKVINGSLLGLSFCLTGKFLSLTREKMEDLINNNKGVLHLTIQKKTNFLVTAEFLEDGRKAAEGKKNIKA